MKYEQVKISDKAFAALCKEWKDTKANSLKREKAYFKDIFYRTDSNLLLPLPGGRVGGLASPVKKALKMSKRQRNRTKHTTQPIWERVEDWDHRFYVRRDMSTELFCDKVWPKKLTKEEEDEQAIADIADKYATLNVNFPHAKMLNTPYANSVHSIVPDTITHNEDLIPGNSALSDIEQNPPEGRKAPLASVRGPVAEAAELQVDPAFTTARSESEDTLDMEDVWKEVYGKAQVLTPKEEERKQRQESEDQFIALAKSRRIAKEGAISTMTFDKLKTLSPAGLCDYLDRAGFVHYTEAFFERGVSGQDLATCDEFDLFHMGMTFRPHRLRMLELLDKVRGTSTSHLRRSLTRTIIDASLTQPYRPQPIPDAYELNISQKVSKAKLADLARKAAEARMLDLAAAKNAEIEALKQAKIRKRLESISELYREAREMVTTFLEKASKDEVYLREYTESMHQVTKENNIAQKTVAENNLTSRERLRQRQRDEADQLDALNAAARLLVKQ